jgi:hypothetical protein
MIAATTMPERSFIDPILPFLRPGR